MSNKKKKNLFSHKISKIIILIIILLFFFPKVATTSGITQITLSKLMPITVTSDLLASTSSIKNNVTYTNETAFNAPVRCSTAFNGDADSVVGNCSNVVDIFES